MTSAINCASDRAYCEVFGRLAGGDAGGRVAVRAELSGASVSALIEQGSSTAEAAAAEAADKGGSAASLKRRTYRLSHQF